MKLKDTSSIRELIKAEMSRQKVSMYELAIKSELAHSAVRKFLQKDLSITTSSMFAMLKSLGIFLVSDKSSKSASKLPGNIKELIAKAFVNEIDNYKADKSLDKRPLNAEMIQELAEKAADSVIKLLNP